MLQMPRIPQIGAPKAGQQTIQLVAGRIRLSPYVRAFTLLSTLQSTLALAPALAPAPGRRHYENSLVHHL